MTQISISELQNIKGIGKKTIDLVRQYIYKRDFAEYKPPANVVPIEPNNVYLGDCLDLMWGIPDGSVDMVLADLPYGTTACSWDSIIPFDQLWFHYKRIVKDRGVVVLFGSEPFSSALRMSNLDMYKYDWKWVKTKVSGFTNAKNKPLNTYEDIIVFSFGVCANGGKIMMKYNPQDLIKIDKQMDGTRKKGDEHKLYRKNNEKKYVQEFTNYPKNIINIKSESKTAHPTQKPISLFEYLIKTYTNENDLILDNTAGSGTTAIAAINTNRRYILMEKEPEYYEIILKRIDKHKK